MGELIGARSKANGVIGYLERTHAGTFDTLDSVREDCGRSLGSKCWLSSSRFFVGTCGLDGGG